MAALTTPKPIEPTLRAMPTIAPVLQLNEIIKEAGSEGDIGGQSGTSEIASTEVIGRGQGYALIVEASLQDEGEKGLLDGLVMKYHPVLFGC
jgi:hypothetical protein